MYIHDNISLNTAEKINILEKVEKVKTKFYIQCIFSENLSVRKIMGKNGAARQVIDENIIWHMSFVCRINMAKDTGSEYVIFIAFPW